MSDPLLVACPFCGAGVGNRCGTIHGRQPSDARYPPHAPHEARIKLSEIYDKLLTAGLGIADKAREKGVELAPDWVPAAKTECTCGHSWLYHQLTEPHVCNECKARLGYEPRRRAIGYVVHLAEETPGHWQLVIETVGDRHRTGVYLEEGQPLLEPWLRFLTAAGLRQPVFVEWNDQHMAVRILPPMEDRVRMIKDAEEGRVPVVLRISACEHYLDPTAPDYATMRKRLEEAVVDQRPVLVTVDVVAGFILSVDPVS
jgi:hypothetical protein